jgi:hypothetical protein
MCGRYALYGSSSRHGEKDRRSRLRALLAHVLYTVLLVGGVEAWAAEAGPITIPSDVSVSLSAEPIANLQAGDVVSFTISVTNNGPEPVHPLSLGSSPILDELDVFGSTADCDYRLVLGVADGRFDYYYFYTWFPILLKDDPLPVGATFFCYFTVPYTQWAPNEFPVTFNIPETVFIDLDPSNNSATVTLHRAGQGAVTPVPTLSPASLSILVALLALFAGVHRYRTLVSLRFSPDARRWRL